MTKTNIIGYINPIGIQALERGANVQIVPSPYQDMSIPLVLGDHPGVDTLRICRNCEFSKYHSFGNIECRRHSPVPDRPEHGQQVWKSRWPVVPDNETCGDFVAKTS